MNADGWKAGWTDEAVEQRAWRLSSLAFGEAIKELTFLRGERDRLQKGMEEIAALNPVEKLPPSMETGVPYVLLKHYPTHVKAIAARSLAREGVSSSDPGMK